MSLDRAGDFIWIAGALILVGSGLLVRLRGLPQGRTLMMMLAWVLIFVALFAAAHWYQGG